MVGAGCAGVPLCIASRGVAVGVDVETGSPPEQPATTEATTTRARSANTMLRAKFKVDLSNCYLLNKALILLT